MPTTVQVTVQTVGSTQTLVVEPDPVIIPPGIRGPIQWQIGRASCRERV